MRISPSTKHPIRISLAWSHAPIVLWHF